MGSATTATPAPTPASAISLPSASALLNIDFNALPGYQTVTLPAYCDATVTALDNTPANNPSSNRIAALGRALFYDRQLGINNSIALAQFKRAMISSGSRWDTAYGQVFNPAAPNRNLNANLPGFSDPENRGRHLFMSGPGAGGAALLAFMLTLSDPLLVTDNRFATPFKWAYSAASGRKAALPGSSAISAAPRRERKRALRLSIPR